MITQWIRYRTPCITHNQQHGQSTQCGGHVNGPTTQLHCRQLEIAAAAAAAGVHGGQGAKIILLQLCLGYHNATISTLIDGQLTAIGGIAFVDHLDRLANALVAALQAAAAPAPASASVANVATHHNAILLDKLAMATYGELMIAWLRIELNAITLVAGETLDAAQEERRCQNAATDEIDDQQINGETIRCGTQSWRYPECAQCQQIDDERDEQQGQYKEIYGHLFFTRLT